jgi:hypothetical protein
MLINSPQWQHLNRLGGGVGIRGISSRSEEGSLSGLFARKGGVRLCQVLVMDNAGDGFNLHGGGGSGDLDVKTVISGQWRDTRGGWGEVLKLVVSGGSVNLPSLDEGIASILYNFTPLRICACLFKSHVEYGIGTGLDYLLHLSKTGKEDDPHPEPQGVKRRRSLALRHE